MTASTTTADHSAVTNRDLLPMVRVAELFRELDRSVPAQLIHTFLFVASHNGTLKTTVEKELGFLTASCSRNIAWLTNEHRLGKPGLGLISKKLDLPDRRRLRLFLTPKGEEVANRIQHILYPSNK